MDVNFFIVAENTGSVNIALYSMSSGATHKRSSCQKARIIIRLVTHTKFKVFGDDPRNTISIDNDLGGEIYVSFLLYKHIFVHGFYFTFRLFCLPTMHKPDPHSRSFDILQS